MSTYDVPGIEDIKLSEAQDPQCCSRAEQVATHSPKWKGQWWKGAQILLMHKLILEQIVTSGRRDRFALR